MQKLVSGFLNTDVMNFVDCPECSQAAGTCCTSYKGKKQIAPHKRRVTKYEKSFLIGLCSTRPRRIVSRGFMSTTAS